MRKLVLLLSVMLSVFVVSCLDENISVNQPATIAETIVSDDVALEELQQQIALLNQEYGFDNAEVQTRSFWKKLFKFVVSTVVADAVGALVGASVGATTAALFTANPTAIAGCAAGGVIVCGVSSSAYVACHQDQVDFLSRQTRATPAYSRDSVMSNLIFQSPELADKSDSVGYYHNLVIFQMYDNDPSIMDPESYYRTDVMDSACSHHKSFANDNFFINTVVPAMRPKADNMISEYLLASEQADDYRTIPTGSNWNINTKIFSMVFDYGTNITSDIQDPNQAPTKDTKPINYHSYTKKYLTLVSNSSITDEEKRILKEAILTGYASNRLWRSRNLK